MRISKKNVIFKTIIAIVLSLNIILISCSDLHKISEFRSSPLGISMKQGIFDVDININNNARVLAYVDFNEDK